MNKQEAATPIKDEVFKYSTGRRAEIMKMPVLASVELLVAVEEQLSTAIKERDDARAEIAHQEELCRSYKAEVKELRDKVRGFDKKGGIV